MAAAFLTGLVAATGNRCGPIDVRLAKFAAAADEVFQNPSPVAGAESANDVELPPERSIAENILLYQKACGGWPKNYARDQSLNDSRRQSVELDQNDNDATIDNGATYTEVLLLAEAFRATNDDRYRFACVRGIRYLLDAQYANGGWPQRFPEPQGYARYITFNDQAMIGVMSLLRDVSQRKGPFSWVPSELRRECDGAVSRGVDCILKCQIRADGRLTVWCAQHHHETFLPEQARSYELPSKSGSESVGIVRFLMQLDNPSPEVVTAIESAVAWLQAAKLQGVKVILVSDVTKPKGFDKVVVHDAEAPPMWARFYDLQTNEPIFCSRDGLPRRALSDISYERRTGYSWLGYYAQSLLEHDWPAWKQRIRPSQ